MIVDELITILGLETDPKAKANAEGFGKILGGVAKLAVAAGAALAAAAGAVAAYSTKQAEAIDTAGKFADSIGISFESLQELEYAAKRSGGSAEELRGDLDKLTKTMSSPVPGEYNQTLFQLGVSARDSTGKLRKADDVLLDIADKFSAMSKQRQLQFAEKLGISPGTVKLMQQGRAGISDLRAEAIALGIVLDENSKVVAAKFQDSLLNSRSVVDALGKSIAIGLLPAMTESLDTFTDWIGANRQFISGAVTQVVEGVAQGFSMIGDGISFVLAQVQMLTGPVDGLLAGLDATQAIAILVAGALAALAVSAVAAALPFIAIAAAIAVVVLILDDLYSAFNGGESIIGGWVDQFQSAFPGISGAIGELLDMLGDVAAFFVGGLAEGVKGWLKIFASVIEGAIGLFVDFLGLVEKLITSSNPFEVLGDLFSKQLDRILGLAKSLGSGISNLFGGMFGGSSVPMTNSSPVPAGVIQGAGGGSTVNNSNTINVNGAGNPSAVANEVINRGGLGQTLQQSRPGLTGPVVG